MPNIAKVLVIGLSSFWAVLLLPACSTSPVSGAQQSEAGALYEQAMEIARVDQTGNPEDLPTARRMLVRSAALDYMPAIHALGWMELQGIGIERDREKAFQHFQRAARAGYAESQYMLGVLYSQGWGVEVSSTDSLYWIKKAAEQGHGEARSMLGRLFATPINSDP